MKRVLPLLTALALVACSPPPVPTPTVELLGAPVTLNVEGAVVSAQATPAVQGSTFSVLVRLRTDRPPLPGLLVTGVYVVTDGGVWKGAVSSAQRASCGTGTCLQGRAAGSAAGLRAGQSVQVVARVQDGQGRTLWLRAPKVQIASAR
ncbi:hypothetical protein [Deinococcus sp.]|uniref:hypothetical protein n=1 Tax=Deinococcus sp. TaxID=47478 RepID=UPI002869CFCF|nr:hypothetical protein [Deinococcus sp.]